MARGLATGTGRLLAPATKGWPRGGDTEGVEIRMGSHGEGVEIRMRWPWEWVGCGYGVEIRMQWPKEWGGHGNGVETRMQWP